MPFTSNLCFCLKLLYYRKLLHQALTHAHCFAIFFKELWLKRMFKHETIPTKPSNVNKKQDYFQIIKAVTSTFLSKSWDNVSKKMYLTYLRELALKILVPSRFTELHQHLIFYLLHRFQRALTVAIRSTHTVQFCKFSTLHLLLFQTKVYTEASSARSFTHYLKLHSIYVKQTSLQQAIFKLQFSLKGSFMP